MRGGPYYIIVACTLISARSATLGACRSSSTPSSRLLCSCCLFRELSRKRSRSTGVGAIPGGVAGAHATPLRIAERPQPLRMRQSQYIRGSCGLPAPISRAFCVLFLPLACCDAAPTHPAAQEVGAAQPQSAPAEPESQADAADSGSPAEPPVNGGAAAAESAAAEPNAAKGSTGWSSFGGDPEHTRSNAAEAQISASNVAQLKLSFDVAAQGVTSTAAVLGGTAYWADWGGFVHATALSDHSELWTHDGSANGGGYTGSPAVTEQMVYVANRTGLLSALDRHTGEARWQTKLDAGPHTCIWSSPALAERWRAGDRDQQSRDRRQRHARSGTAVADIPWRRDRRRCIHGPGRLAYRNERRAVRSRGWACGLQLRSTASAILLSSARATTSTRR